MKLDISDNFSIDANKFVTDRTCIIGQSGSGKSYAIAVICEELAKNNIGFCIIDVEGEYFSLKERYPILWVGMDPNADIDISRANFTKLAKKLIQKGFPAILDVSEVDDPKLVVASFIRELYKFETKLRLPYLLIIEEIDRFAPQSGKPLEEIEEVSRRGRKRGLGLTIATQRPALVNKNILSQCGNQIIGKLTIQNDIDAVKIFFSDKNDVSMLPQMKPGQFFVMGNIGNNLVQIRKRETTHKATTPTLIQKKAIEIADLKKLEEEIETQQSETIEEEDIEEIKKEIVPIKITKEDVYKKIKKRTKQFLLFGKEATITKLNLLLYPLYHCKIKYLKKGLIKKDFVDETTYFDAVTGNVVSLKNGFFTKINISTFIGLKQHEIKIFNKIFNSKGKTRTELLNECALSETSVAESIRNLKEKNLITHKKEGKNIIYIPFTKVHLPKIEEIKEKEVQTKQTKISAKLQKEVIDIKDLRNLVKGIIEESDITYYTIIYYPFYVANLIRGKKKWSIKVDAVTGKIFT